MKPKSEPIVTANINGNVYPVKILETYPGRGTLYVRTTNNAEPFGRWTHGGWANYSDGEIAASAIRIEQDGQTYCIVWVSEDGFTKQEVLEWEAEALAQAADYNDLIATQDAALGRPY